MDIRRILKNLDWWLIFAVLALMACGLCLIKSATFSLAQEEGEAWHFNRQCIFMGIGFGLLLLSLLFDYRVLRKYANYIYFFNICLLIMVMLFGTTQLGAQRWIKIGSLSFQPSEFAKVFLIICLATFMEKRIEWFDEFKSYIPVFLYIFLPFILVMKQPDLGTSLTFIAILLGMMFVSGFKYKWFAILAAMLTACMPAFWYILKEYQKNRIRVFLNPELDPYGSGYHVIQSKIAIGSGGFLGKGWMQGSQSQLSFLPENHTDFIFAVCGEEFGFIGCVVIILLYAIIIWRGVAIALEADDEFGTLLAVGVTSMFMFHILVNIGMTAGIMPVTGVPLPFLSYGVSSLATNLMLVGILLNIKLRVQKLSYL